MDWRIPEIWTVMMRMRERKFERKVNYLVWLCCVVCGPSLFFLSLCLAFWDIYIYSTNSERKRTTSCREIKVCYAWWMKRLEGDEMINAETMGKEKWKLNNKLLNKTDNKWRLSCFHCYVIVRTKIKLRQCDPLQNATGHFFFFKNIYSFHW